MKINVMTWDTYLSMISNFSTMRSPRGFREHNTGTPLIIFKEQTMNIWIHFQETRELIWELCNFTAQGNNDPYSFKQENNIMGKPWKTLFHLQFPWIF